MYSTDFLKTTKEIAFVLTKQQIVNLYEWSNNKEASNPRHTVFWRRSLLLIILSYLIMFTVLIHIF